jgi:serine/threonine protein kinase
MDLNTLIHQDNFSDKEYSSTEWKQCYLDGVITKNIPSRIHYIKDLLQGLNYMHKMGILHRDIKPENLLIMSDNRLCICDFGSACVLLYNKISSESTKIHGTIQYTDIEILTSESFSKKTYNQNADLWSAACSILEMITSIPLVIRSSPESIIFDLELVLNHNNPLICIDNIILRSLLLSMLALNSEFRITSDHALSELDKISC